MRSNPIPSNRWPLTWKIGLILILVFVIGYSVWLTFAPGSAHNLWIGNFAKMLVIGLVLLLALGLKRQLAQRDVSPWNYIIVGFGLWGVAALIETLFYLLRIQGMLPPSLADLPHLAGYLALFVGLLSYPLISQRRFGQFRLVMDMVISTLAVIALGWFIFIQPVIQNIAQDWIVIFWSVVYPVTDLALLVILLNVMFLAQSQEFFRTFMLIAAGVLFLLVSDLAYAYLAPTGQYEPGGLQDLGWILGFAMMALGILLYRFKSNNSLGTPFKPRLAMINRRVQESLPFAATLVMLWYTLSGLRTTHQVNPILVGVTFFLGMALIARQGVAAGEVELQEYAYLVDHVADPVFICDESGRLKLVNPALVQAIHSNSEENWLKRSIVDLFQPGDLPGSLIEKSLMEGWSGEVEMLRQDGSASFPVYLSLRPTQRERSARRVIAGVAHDLTEQKHQQAVIKEAYDQIAAAHQDLELLNEQLEHKVVEKTRSLSDAYQQLELQNQTLQQLDQLKSDFVSLVSHELRAPLTNISGGIELTLQGSDTLPENVARTLTLVQAQTQRLTHFVETILDLSALEAGRMPLYPAPLTLQEACDRLLARFSNLPGVERLEMALPADLPMILADDQALTSVLFHLVDNALKYTQQGSIRISAWTCDPQMEICVSDRGPGIPDEVKPLLFERFFRISSGDAQMVYGHGLGLYIVRRLITAMNGAVRIEDNPGGGTRFIFSLPVFYENEEIASRN